MAEAPPECRSGRLETHEEGCPAHEQSRAVRQDCCRRPCDTSGGHATSSGGYQPKSPLARVDKTDVWWAQRRRREGRWLRTRNGINRSRRPATVAPATAQAPSEAMMRLYTSVTLCHPVRANTPRTSSFWMVFVSGGSHRPSHSHRLAWPWEPGPTQHRSTRRRWRTPTTGALRRRGRPGRWPDRSIPTSSGAPRTCRHRCGSDTRTTACRHCIAVRD